MNRMNVAPGQLDPSFGTNGLVPMPFPVLPRDVPRAVYVRPDQKIYVATRNPLDSPHPAAIVRLDEAGQLDRSFADGGVRTIPFSRGMFDPAVVKPTSNGGCLVTGEAVFGFNDEFAAARVLQNGQMDTSFGEGGVAIIRPKQLLAPISLEGDREAHLQAAQRLNLSVTDIGTVVMANGKILLTGTIFYPDRFVGFVVRLNSDGSPDESFNKRGCAIIEPLPAWGGALALDVVVQKDGKVLVCGEFYSPFEGKQNTGYVLRLGSDGAIDGSFGDSNNGIVLIEAEDQPNALTSMALKDDDGIFASGETSIGGLITSLNPNGSFNLVFNGGQPLISKLPGLRSRWTHCHLLKEGKLVVTGVDNGDAWITARYHLDGTLDRTFGGEGWVTFDEPRGREIFTGSSVTADNRVVLAARFLPGSLLTGYLLRYQG